MNFKPIIIVSGEPYSIFLEIFFKIKKNRFKRPIIIIASKKLLLNQMKMLKFNFKVNLIDKKNISYRDLDNKKINVIDVHFKFNKTFDIISDKSNEYIKECFKIAIKLLKTNKYIGMINGPISKKNFLKEKFLGITEYLAHKTKQKKFAMLIYNKNLSVCPITTHLPLKDVSKNITKSKIINQAKLIHSFYKKRFKKTPNIAITGLNPHCESNYSSSEEKNIIIPSIEYLAKKNIKLDGPFAADTLFMKQAVKKYDVIIGMYHDQVLTPAKTLFEFKSFNITLGLPFIRISPDHGPNTLMLGKNLSNPQSLLEALKFLDK
ncbi:4-hydroxythreonine-4-phosphate dehydrogenase PdxA [Candidatus Pelagibacter sp.]|nr:4-hydroxythreonine-4-phosphate dehydrogenase PdxA [Candidatus Pelagibacter sp.]